LLPVVVDNETLAWLLANPGAELSIDVDTSTLTLPTGLVVHYPIDAFARYCLLQGIDQLGFLQQNLAAIEKFEEQRTWKP
jgi:3-isopropylmalate/(R)-2-methylmalate dehydratase small subunit